MRNSTTNFLDRVLGGAADLTGKGVEAAGYSVGRVAPKIQRAAKAIADTTVGSFLCSHFAEGYDKGYAQCIKQEALAVARKELLEQEKAKATTTQAKKAAKSKVKMYLAALVQQAKADGKSVEEFVSALLDGVKPEAATG